MLIHLCPVCRTPVKPTVRANIPAHMDTLKFGVCPAGGEPFRITLAVSPEFTGVQR